jgi:hypothetical protein
MRARFGGLTAPIEKGILLLSEAVLCYECGTYWDALGATIFRVGMMATAVPVGAGLETGTATTTEIKQTPMKKPSSGKGSTKKKKGKKKKGGK